MRSFQQDVTDIWNNKKHWTFTLHILLLSQKSRGQEFDERSWGWPKEWGVALSEREGGAGGVYVWRLVSDVGFWCLYSSRATSATVGWRVDGEKGSKVSTRGSIVTYIHGRYNRKDVKGTFHVLCIWTLQLLALPSFSHNDVWFGFHTNSKLIQFCDFVTESWDMQRHCCCFLGGVSL